MPKVERVFLPWGAFAPDLGEFGHDSLTVCENVAPAFGNFYPVPRVKLGAGTQGTLCGFHCHTQWGQGHVFYAGDAHGSGGGKLYTVSTNGATFTNASRLSGGGYTSQEWNFTSFGETIVGANYNDAVQSIASSGANFADLFTSTFKPRFRFPFSVKGNLFGAHCNLPAGYDTLSSGANPFLYVWSATDAPASMGSANVDPQLVGAGFQQITNDKGHITAGFGAGEYGLVFQEKAIARIDGPPYGYRTISEGLSTRYPYSVVKVGEDVYFWGRSGPAVLRNGDGPALDLAHGRVARALVDNFAGLAHNLGAFYDAAVPPTAHEGVSATYIPRLSSVVWQGLSNDRISSQWVLYNVREDRFSYAQPTASNTIAAFLRQRPEGVNGLGQWLPTAAAVGLGASILSAGAPPSKLATFEFGQSQSSLPYRFGRGFEQLDKDATTRVLRARPVHRLSPGAADLTLTVTTDDVNTPSGTPVTAPANPPDSEGWCAFDSSLETAFHRIRVTYEFDDDASPNLMECQGVEIEFVLGAPYGA